MRPLIRVFGCTRMDERMWRVFGNRAVALTFDLPLLVETSIFATAASDLLLQLADTTPVSPLFPGEDQLPVHRDVDPHLIAVTSSSDGTVRNAPPEEVKDIVDSASAGFTTTKVALACNLVFRTGNVT